MSWRDIKHPWAGGSEVYLHEISKKLIAKGHDVTMFCAGHPGGSLPYEEIDGIKTYRSGNMITVYVNFFWKYLTQFRGKFDIVIDQNNGIPFFSPMIVSSVPVINLTHHIHHNQWFKQIKWPLNYIGYFLEKYLVPLAYRYTKFVVVSESTKRDVCKFWGISPENVSVVYNAVGGEYKKTLGKSRNPSIIYVGRLKKYKQVDLIIKSMLRLMYDWPDLTLHIVGSGDEMEYLKDLASRMGVGKSVVFHGYVSDKLKVDLLSSAWVFATASSHEGWGISVIEANACGTLAVGSDIDGLKDAIVDHETGLLFEQGNIFDLSAKIRQVLKNPGLRYCLEKNSIERAKRFKWGVSALKLEKILQQEINQSNKISNFKPMQSKFLNKKTLPKVSIVLPTKNVADYVLPTFESIKSQTYPNIELIVVDNFSTDETRKIARKFTDKVFKKGPERNHQRNLAVAKARGKYLLFIDSDMVMDKNLVADCVYQLEKFPKSVAVILPEIQVGKSIWSKARALEKKFYLGCETIESPRFFRKNIYLKSGGYDENLLYAEDMELTSRIKKLGSVKRSRFYVYHNEDRLSLWNIVRKKYGYGKSAKHYFAKISGQNDKSKEVTKSGWLQKTKAFVANPWVYLAGGKVEDENKAAVTTKFVRPVFWEKRQYFLDDPFISLVFFYLRFTELSAMGLGYLVSLGEGGGEKKYQVVRKKS